MALTPYGFDGSVDERAWALMNQTGGPANTVSGPSDWKVTAVASQRSVSVAAGYAMSRGVLVYSDAAIQLDLTAPSGGQWWLIALSVDWGSNTANPVALAGATTANATPNNIPSSLPAGYASTAGGSAHMPLAWVWVNATTTNLVIVDVRTVRPSYVNQGIWGPYGAIPSGPAGARDVYYNLATNGASYAGANYVQGAEWYNTDLDRMERYYGKYLAGSNPGGASTSGWYPATPNDNYNPNIGTSGWGGTITISPGNVATLRSFTITTPVPATFDLYFATNFNSSSDNNVNIAGSIQFQLDGVDTDTPMRFHTHASSGNVSYPWHNASSVFVTPGTHTIAVRASIENASSNGGYFQDNTIHAWSK
jgi:hypothetical protein